MLSSVRKRISASELTPIEESPAGEEEEEEDPMVTKLEQDEAETEAETQRKRDSPHSSKTSHPFVFQLETPTTSAETFEMAQTNQNVLRLLEDDEKVRSILSFSSNPSSPSSSRFP